MFVPRKISLFTNAILAKLRWISESIGTYWLLNILCLPLKAKNYSTAAATCWISSYNVMSNVASRFQKWEKKALFLTLHTLTRVKSFN